MSFSWVRVSLVSVTKIKISALQKQVTGNSHFYKFWEFPTVFHATDQSDIPSTLCDVWLRINEEFSLNQANILKAFTYFSLNDCNMKNVFHTDGQADSFPHWQNYSAQYVNKKRNLNLGACSKYASEMVIVLTSLSKC